MKTKKWGLINAVICILIVLVTLCGRFFVGRIIDYEKYMAKFRLKPERITRVRYISEDFGQGGNNGSFTTNDEKEIKVLIDCIKKVYENNKTADKTLNSDTKDYHFIFFDKNSVFALDYEYNVYYIEGAADPFDEFFGLQSVQTKMAED